MTKYIFYFLEDSSNPEYAPLWIRQDGARDIYTVPDSRPAYSLEEIKEIAELECKDFLAFKIYEGDKPHTSEPITPLIHLAKATLAKATSWKVYAIKHNPTGFYFPSQFTRNARLILSLRAFGDSYNPRLFNQRTDAQLALKSFLNIPDEQERGKLNDYEIVPLTLMENN